MFPRVRIAFGLALGLTMVTSITVFAKGGISYITITGANLKDEVHLNDPSLTTDYFAFADFNKGGVEAPDDPGIGYEITRYIMDHYVTGHREINHVAWGREVAFDRLHYYPDTGFVYYDGIVNGSSEYDGKWYTARPGIEVVFKKAISNHIQTAPVIAQPQLNTLNTPAQSSAAANPSRNIILMVGIAGLVVILMLGLRFRRSTLTNS